MPDDYALRTMKLVMWASVGILVFVLLFGTFYTISAGERGVLLTFGKAKPVAITEGLHFKIPLVQSVEVFDIKTLKYETDATAASSDLQTVTTKLAINYHVLPDQVPRIYTEIGVDYASRVIQPLEQEIIKATTAKFTAEELITKRESVREDIKSTLKERLEPRGIIVEEVSITNFDFSSSFNEAIEAKVTAEQSALAAKNKLEQVKFEAEQKVASATAEAKALELQKAQVTPELIELRKIEVQSKAIDKWNGVMPIVVGSSSPFIDISSLLGVKNQT